METEIGVKIGEMKGEQFWTESGLRQGCPFSPLLFNVLLADMAQSMRRNKKGGTILKRGKVYSLAYVDNVTKVPYDEREMDLIIRVFEKFVTAKDFTRNVSKTKMVCLRNEKRRVRMKDK